MWDVYWFENNMQSDVVAVYNEAGTKLVSYIYDAWGNFTTTYHNGGAYTKAADNPFTYRGYYYDKDLGLYYLQSRYYDSNTCRLLNADKYINANGDILGYNMFAYCGNNPVMNVDPPGEWTFSYGISFSAFFIVGVSYSINLSFDDNGNIAIQATRADVFNEGVTLGVASIGISETRSITKYDTINDLEGTGITAGFTVPVYGPVCVGADVILGDDSPSVDGASISAGLGLGVDLHASGGKTHTLVKFNIVEPIVSFLLELWGK